MNFSIEQMRAWDLVPHKALFLSELLAKDDGSWRSLHKLWRALPRENWPGVYCAWANDSLLYIGYSQHVFKRVGQYNLSDFNPNYSDVYLTRFTARRCESAEEAAALEAALIAAHHPPHNHRREPNGGQVRRFKRGR